MIIESNILIDYEKRIKDIKDFINKIEYERSLLSNESIKSKLNPEHIELIKKNVKSAIDYKAVIISCATSFESHIKEALESYLSKLNLICTKYESLPEKLKIKHKSKIGEYLSSPNKYQYYELEEKEAVRNLWNSYDNNPDYKLSIPLLLESGGNFKGNRLRELIQDLGIDNHFQILANSSTILDAFKDCTNQDNYGADNKLLYMPLNDLIIQRNIVAHNWINDNRISYKKIENILDYLFSIAQETEKILNDQLIKDLKKFEQLTKVNHIYSVSTKTKKIIMSNEISLEKGMFIYYETQPPNGKKENLKIYQIKECKEIENDKLEIYLTCDKLKGKIPNISIYVSKI
ncbi:MAG: HEPN domain-containing protein [Fusobacteriaceae bacterium]